MAIEGYRQPVEAAKEEGDRPLHTARTNHRAIATLVDLGYRQCRPGGGIEQPAEDHKEQEAPDQQPQSQRVRFLYQPDTAGADVDVVTEEWIEEKIGADAKEHKRPDQRHRPVDASLATVLAHQKGKNTNAQIGR